MNQLRQYIREILKEAITLDIEVGDVILTGKFKNKRQVVKSIGKDEYGHPTINGRSILKLKIEKQLPKKKWSAKSREELSESLLKESTEFGANFKQLMDSGYEGMIQAIELAESMDIPTQDLPWTAELVLLYVDHHHMTVFGRRSSGMSWDKEVEQILEPTGWTWKEYKHASDRRDSAQSIEYQLAKSGWMDERLSQHTGQLLKESAEEVAKIMQLVDADEWDQARELAYMLGPEVSRHPDLKIWTIISANPELRGDVAIEGLNYDQAMDPKYQAFAGLEGGFQAIDPEDGQMNHGADASITPPDQDDFDEAEQILNWEKSNIEIVAVHEEHFYIEVRVDPYDRKQDGHW